MAKAKLSTRILNAYRALRGEPWPAVIEGPKITYTRPKVATYVTRQFVPWERCDLQGPEVVEEYARRRLLQQIGPELMDAGVIVLDKNPDFANGGTCYQATLRVVMPEKEDDTNGQ